MNEPNENREYESDENPFHGAKYPAPGQMQYVSVGMEFFLINAAFIALGYWVDITLHSRPAFMLLGLIVGFPLALWRLIQQVRPYLKSYREWKKKQKEEKQKQKNG